jgi:hypothetical protein
MTRRLRIATVALLAVMAVSLTACYGYPDTTLGNSAGLARAEADQYVSRASNPPWALPGGFDCWSFVNYVERTAGTPNWRDWSGPNDTAGRTWDWFGPRAGDIVTFGDPSQPHGGNIHMGIVTIVSQGDFSSVEWNSGENPDQVVANQHPNDFTTPAWDTGLVMTGVYVP